jgi:hypothetical protein
VDATQSLDPINHARITNASRLSLAPHGLEMPAVFLGDCC